MRQDLHDLQTLQKIPKVFVSELQHSYIPSTRSVLRSSSQRILHQNSTAMDGVPDVEEQQSSPPMKKHNNDANETTSDDTETETITLSLSSSSASASLSSYDTTVNVEDEFEADVLEVTSIPMRTPEEQSSTHNLVIHTTSTHTVLPHSTSEITFERTTLLQAKHRTLDSNSSSIPGHTYTYADDIVHSTPNYHPDQQQMGYRVVAETTAMQRKDKNVDTHIDRTEIDTTSTNTGTTTKNSQFWCDATSILETVFLSLQHSSQTIRENGAASVTTLDDPSYDIVETAFLKRRKTPAKVRGNGVLDDGTVHHAFSETTPSVGGEPGRTSTTPAVTATCRRRHDDQHPRG